MLSKLDRSQIIRCFSSKKLGIGEATVALE